MKSYFDFRKWARRTILVTFLFNLTFLAVLAQVTVTGTVTMETGETVPGTTIQEKGTTNGTITDVDGNYSITVAGSEAVLVYSFVGYETQEIIVGNRTVINTTLAVSTTVLDEIVVTGYGTQSRATVTTSVSKVSADDLRSTPITSNPATALIGKVAGLNIVETDGRPHTSPQIWIRGGTDFGPTNDSPLYVIDGVVREDMDDINPSDIESFNILKDAASTAIYGARASNGVILIQTKGGSVGKTSVNFRYDYQWTNIDRYKQDFLPYKEEVWYQRVSSARSVDPGWSAEYYGLLKTATYTGTGGGEGTRTSLQFAQPLKDANGGQLPAGFISIIDPVYGDEIAWYPWDWQDQVFQNGHANNYNLDFSGGNDRGTYYSSLNFYNNDGVAPGTSYERFSITTNADYKIIDKLKVGANINYSYLDDGMSGYDEDGYRWYERAARLPSTIRYRDEITGELVPGNSGKPNPDYWLNVNDIKDVKSKTTLSTFLEWEIIDGLTFRPFAALYKNDLSYGRYQKSSAYNGRRQSNGSNRNILNTQLDATLSYVKSLGQDHFVNAVLGTSFINENNYYVGGSTYGAATDLILTMNAGALENDDITSTLNRSALQSWFGRVTYTYKDRYLATASIRRDGASIFSEKNKWANFPGLSAGWNLHNEGFWSIDAISKLKLRASWGLTGKIRNIDIFDTQGQYAGVLYAGQVGIQNTQLANTDLVWESTTAYDIGFDMGLFSNRIILLVDYYHKDSHDRLYSKDLPSFTGFSAITTNYGSYINRGVEFEVTATPVQGPLNWQIALNWSYNKGTVGKLPDNGNDKNRDGGVEVWDEATGAYVWIGGYAEGERPDALIGLTNSGPFSTQAEADAYHVIDTYNKDAWPLKMAGDTKWNDLDGNGLIDGFDRVITGYSQPNHRGGMTNVLSYKGLDFTFIVDWALGHTVYEYGNLRIYANSQGEDRTNIDVQNQWFHEGDVTNWPRTTRGDQNGPGNSQKNPGPFNATWFYPGDYLAFRELALSYRIAPAIINRIPGVQGIQLNLSARNLGWLKNKNLRNPEEIDGVDRYMYPVPFTLSGGVKLTF